LSDHSELPLSQRERRIGDLTSLTNIIIL
jgi:hypothetical protein